jgi:hypothetical protein
MASPKAESKVYRFLALAKVAFKEQLIHSAVIAAAGLLVLAEVLPVREGSTLPTGMPQSGNNQRALNYVVFNCFYHIIQIN